MAGTIICICMAVYLVMVVGTLSSSCMFMWKSHDALKAAEGTNTMLGCVVMWKDMVIVLCCVTAVHEQLQ